MTDSTDEDAGEGGGTGGGGVILDGPFDPDAQATVSDYVDYTEYLPADVIRSLTLIRYLDERYLESSQKVHELTKIYSRLPEIPLKKRPNLHTLRKEISAYLDRAINARECSNGEASRLYDVVDRHFGRLDCIRQKLRALPPIPPPEPSPAAAATNPAGSQNNKKNRTRRGDSAPSGTRITLRLDDKQHTTTQKSRGRRSGVTVNHLASMHPDSPIASTEQSDAEGESSRAVRQPSAATAAIKQPNKSRKMIKSRSQQPGSTPGTGPTPGPRSHRNVAGITTSNALALLEPPPENARPGGTDLPWLRLTEWELTKLRKKMKKNAIWQPSEIMVHRELALLGRGWEGYKAAKAEAEAAGNEVVDCDDIMNNYVEGELIPRTDIAQEVNNNNNYKTNSTGTENKNKTEEAETTKFSNRGVKLNVAKRIKREHFAKLQAEYDAKVKAGLIPDSTSIIPGQGQEQEQEGTTMRSSRKRKPQETEPESNGITPTSSTSRKRTRTGGRGETSTDNTKQTQTSTTASTTAPAPTRAPIPRLKIRNTSTPPVPVSRLRSGAGTNATSSEAITNTNTIGGRGIRRHKSTTPAIHATSGPIQETTRESKRRKRPTPGPVASSNQDGGATVSYGRRKAKPTPTKKRISGRNQKSIARKPSTTRSSPTPTSTPTTTSTNQNRNQNQNKNQELDLRIDEDGIVEEVDPNEPRYCICGDVSFGMMICCENSDVSIIILFLLPHTHTLPPLYIYINLTM